MDDPQTPDAATLRAMGIDHPRLSDDGELVATVVLLQGLGVTLDEMIGQDLTFIAGPRAIRPDATIDPTDVFDFSNDLEFSREMILALGFPFDPEAGIRLTPAEATTIRFFNERRAMLGDEDTLALIRVLGTAMARVSRSLISSLRIRVEMPILEETDSIIEATVAYQDLVRSDLPKFLDAASTVLRRHLALQSGPSPLWDVESSEAATIEFVAVGFVDMVGFTSFTERAAQGELVETLRSFERQVNSIIVSNGGILVKLIGDEAMFVAADVESGLQIAAELCCLPLAERGPTSVRVGMACGEVIAIDGDYYGTVVNVAARAVQVAEPDSMLVTGAVRDAAKPSWTFTSTGEHELRGLSTPVELLVVDGESLPTFVQPAER